MHGELQWLACRRVAPHANARILTITTKNVIDHLHIAQTVHIVVVIADDALQRVHSRFAWRHSVTHVLDDRVSTGYLDVLFTTPGSACRTYILVAIKSRFGGWGGGQAAQPVSCQTASRRCA